jgi:hypothetical protein
MMVQWCIKGLSLENDATAEKIIGALPQHYWRRRALLFYKDLTPESRNAQWPVLLSLWCA